MNEFDTAIRNSIEFKDERHLNKKRDDQKYYDEKYADPIKKYFDEKEIDSLEINYNSRYKCTSICAFASSARLCYLYFKPQGATFEKPLYNGLKNSRPTKMDAVIGNKNYECKCQEIVSKSHTPLSKRYIDLIDTMFKEFGVKEYTVNAKTYEDQKTNKTITRYEISFKVSELNIKLQNDPYYNHLHFDLKQLICHLLAIANEYKGNDSCLQYVFFTPSKSEMENEKIKKLYAELKEEMEAIFDSNSKISLFAKNHNINIPRPIFVPIDTIDDFNYKEAFIN